MCPHGGLWMDFWIVSIFGKSQTTLLWTSVPEFRLSGIFFGLVPKM